MMVAVMAQTVTSMRRSFGDIDDAAVIARYFPLAKAEERRQPAVVGVDFDIHAHAGAQQVRVLALVEGDAHRHALHHLHPVAAGVLRRQDRELRAGAGATDCTVPLKAWSGKLSTSMVAFWPTRR